MIVVYYVNICIFHSVYYISFRSMEACLELNLLTGVEFHESLVGSARIREEDQAMCAFVCLCHFLLLTHVCYCNFM